MFYNARNGKTSIEHTDMDHIRFGTGPKNLIIIPGLGDGLRTVKGAALPFAFAYRAFAKDFTVSVFSRRNELEEGFSTRYMARDLKTAMDRLAIPKAYVLGVSQGGMIAQYLAIDYPEAVEGLILAVTLAKQNETIQKTVGDWRKLAQAGDFRSIFIDTMERSYSEHHLKRYRRYYPIMLRLSRPKDLSRFIIQADACLQHDAYDALDAIECPVLAIGGGKDKVVGPEAVRELARRIKNSRVVVYPELGHGAYEEAEDFNRRVLEFCRGGA